MSFVADSSVTLNWCFPNEHTPATLSLLQAAKRRAVFVPAIWPFEMSNVLGLAQRKGRISDVDLNLVLAMLDTLDLHVDMSESQRDLRNLMAAMQPYSLTAYDAAYLALAIDLKLPLATLDVQLAEAAKNCGVSLLL
jgi:predicted nucleic acid-binding protein